MSLLDQLGNVLKQYTSGSTPNAANATEHFDQVAQVAPQSVIAEGLSAVFRSDQTPLSVTWSAACSASRMGSKKLAF